MTDAFWDSYIAALLWVAPDLDSGKALDGEYSVTDFDPTDLAEHKERVSKWYDEHKPKWGILWPDGDVGSDFALTHNMCGAGFWDGDWPEPLATKLTEASHAFGNWIVVTGNRKLYIVRG